MNAEERLLEYGYEDVKYLINESYDDALIGVTEDGRAVYDLHFVDQTGIYTDHPSEGFAQKIQIVFFQIIPEEFRGYLQCQSRALEVYRPDGLKPRPEALGRYYVLDNQKTIIPYRYVFLLRH